MLTDIEFIPHRIYVMFFANEMYKSGLAK